MKLTDFFKKSSLCILFAASILVTGCDDDDPPPPENEVEVITDFNLIFTNDADPTDIVEARAQDPDGAGAQELEILDAINLTAGQSYTLSFDILNNLETPGEDIGEEIAEEDDEHQFFFSFSEDAFTNPTGNGNIDSVTVDAISYNDSDGNGNPVGLSTSWTTSATALSGGSFTVRLQHLPEIKTSTSSAADGDTDIDLTFVLNIE